MKTKGKEYVKVFAVINKEIKYTCCTWSVQVNNKEDTADALDVKVLSER